MIYDGSKVGEYIPKNKTIWMFACRENEITPGFQFKPVKGQINNDNRFVKDIGAKYTLSGKFFSDTYDEAAYYYNKLIDKRINWLREEIKKLENMKV